MIRSFKNTRLYALVGGILGAAIGMGGILALSPLNGLGQNLAVGAVVAIIVVNFVLFFVRQMAMRQYNEILALLYRQLDPEAFLEQAEPLLKTKIDPAQYANTVVHIANGYMMAGQPGKALETLDALPVPETAGEMRALVDCNRTSCYLDMGKLAEARQSMAATRRLLQDPKCKEAFAERVQRSLDFQQLQMEVLEGETAPMEALEKEFAGSQSAMHKTMVGALLLQVYRKAGEKEKFDETRAYIIENGKKLAAVRQAEKAAM